MLEMREPTAKSLTLDILSTLSGRSLPVSALIAAGELFGIAENGMRVAIARLLAAGAIARDERGRYRMGASADPVDRLVRGWRHIDERTRRWEGRWIGVQGPPVPHPRRQALRRRDQAFGLLGFEELVEGLVIRPDNLQGGVDAIRGQLTELGIPTGALVFEVAGLDAAAESHARSLWDVAALCDGYSVSLEAVTASASQLADLAPEQAMVESFLLGGRIIRQLVLDPLLPEPIVPIAERKALVRAMRKYDKLGRRAWSDFMARHGAPHAGAPAHTGAVRLH